MISIADFDGKQRDFGLQNSFVIFRNEPLPIEETCSKGRLSVDILKVWCPDNDMS